MGVWGILGVTILGVWGSWGSHWGGHGGQGAGVPQGQGLTPMSPELPGPRVAILREEGSNGDREMAAAFVMAGFQVRDPPPRTLTPTLTPHLLGVLSPPDCAGGGPKRPGVPRCGT